MPGGHRIELGIDPKANRRAQASRTNLEFSRSGEKRTFTLRFVVTRRARLDYWEFGNLTWAEAGGRYTAFSRSR